MQQNLVSIVIPVYNCEKYISKCIESILKQTYTNFEVIIINDGSTDNTSQEIEKYNDERIKLHCIKNNGVSNARNKGIELSKGEYITFIDADDYIAENHLEKLVFLIKKYNVDIIRFNAYEQKNNKIKKIEFPQPNYSIINSKKDNEIKKVLNSFLEPKKSLRGYCWLLFMKNNNIIKFCTDLKYLEDKLFCIENMINKKKTLLIDECLYYYMNNTSSKTKNIEKFIENIEDLMKSKKYIDNLCIQNNYENRDYVDYSYLSLVLYRLDYLCGKTSYRKFKFFFKKVLKLNCTQNILILNPKYLNKFKKTQFVLLKNKLYFIYYMITRIKINIRG